MIEGKNNVPTYFFLRRLFSLTGVFPLGLFILSYFYLNSKSLHPKGVQFYNTAIQSLQEIPFLILWIIIFVGIPLLFHIFFGLVVFYKGRSHVTQYSHSGHIRYFFQRVSGLVGLVFIVYHFSVTQLMAFITDSQVDYLWMVRLMEVPWRVCFYMIGMLALTFYLMNHVWNFLINWGITIRKSSQRLSLYFCMIVFVFFNVDHLLILSNYYYHYEEAPGWIRLILLWVKGAFFL